MATFRYGGEGESTMIVYTLYQIGGDGSVWSSHPATFEARARYHVVQAVDGAWYAGHYRWAEGVAGDFLYGRDPRGKVITARPSLPEGKVMP